ncbi:MAG: hypothetical protein V2A56_11875, partial [bacterium]
IKNPFFQDKWIIICAGLGCYGTSGSAFILSKSWKSFWKRYKNNDFCAVVRVKYGSDESARIVSQY